MDYEKEYKNLVAKVKNAHLYAQTDSTKNVLEDILPELRDSEDERIRKRLLKYFQDFKPVCDNEFLPPFTIDDILAWLEKQKEPTKEELYAEVGTTEKEYIANTMKMVRAMREKKQEQKPAEIDFEDWDTLGYIRDIVRKHVRRDEEFNALDKWLTEHYVNQKPAEWSEEDEKMLADTIFKLAGFMGNEKNIDWLKSLRPQPREEIYQSAKHDLAIKFMNYLDENRPEGKMSLSNGECEDIDKAFKENDWAKIMRYVEKYSPQPKVVWSEEDEQFLLICKNALYKYQRTDQWDANIISKWLDDKLKSLRPSWKPSEEQMDALQRAIDACESEWAYQDDELRSLLNDIKKL